MPQSKKAIQVPVNVKLEIANQHKVLSNLAGDMQETMSGFDPASALYKNAVKSFSKIASKLNFSEALLGKDFFSEADLNRVVKEMGMVSDLMTEINFKIQNTKSFKTLGIDTTELDNARESLSALRKEISKQNNKSVGSLMGTGKGQVSSSFLGELQGLSSKSGFKADKSYATNITTMTSKLEQQKATYQSLQNEIDKATQEAEEYLNVTGRLANDISGVKLKGTNANIAAAMSKMIRSHTVGEDGDWAAGGKTYAQATSRWLGLGQIDFSKSAQEIADAIEQAINAAFSEKGGRTGNALVQNARKYSTGTDAEKQAIEDLVQEDSNLALKQVEELKKNATAHNQLTSSIEAQITTLKQLREAYEGEVKRLNQGSVDAAQQRVDNAYATANEQAQGLRDNAKGKNKTIGGAEENLYKTQDANAEERRLANLQKEEADRRAKEAEVFKENLQQSVRHWMSAQQIINIVKDGIRQAYQDIQGLDAAMSNIAVVTDMSISDLWGKINDYMAIAQQYGVTTQGVYEVSQLYYQQGLATAEVMELTTETLKLARVANMDYKDSADAMTVALRGFKMEMSEAATVTDVYSKVAAITASDQAELAVAMSKTASSAASVGSSFENTTAMLAVMVETTRESAQNLGSALKSIISRYGEMKSGLTQDSEGEIIDYNKVDTALRSIGISIKDAQGQFRDFDDVIFELSEAWGSLDKNTQRYIATIMAGNRQQSRFIALVDNYERLKEVSEAADNSEDAGLLQYAKTLDSLETKLNNIKTSFQQFYMNIFNGPVIGAALDGINKLIQGFNRLGSLSGILSVINIISGLKSILSVVIALFSNSFSTIISNWRAMQQQWLSEAGMRGAKRGKAEREAYEAELNKSANKKSNGTSNKLVAASTAFSAAGGIASLVGSSLSGKGSKTMKAGAIINAGGSMLTGVGMGAMFGVPGMIAGGILGSIVGILGNILGINEKIAKAKVDEAKQAANDANIQRAKSTDEFKTLQQYAKKFEDVKAARNDSNEAYEEWISLNNEIAEKYPELISYIDAEGNSIVNLSDSYEGLALAKQKALQDNKEYWSKQLEYYKELINYDRSAKINGAKDYLGSNLKDNLSIDDNATYGSRISQGYQISGEEFLTNRQYELDMAYFLGGIDEQTWKSASEKLDPDVLQAESLINKLLGSAKNDGFYDGSTRPSDAREWYDQLKTLFESNTDLQNIFGTEYDLLLRIFSNEALNKSNWKRTNTEKETIEGLQDEVLKIKGEAKYSISNQDLDLTTTEYAFIDTLGQYIDASKINDNLNINKQFRTLLKYWDLEQNKLKELQEEDFGNQADWEAYKSAKNYYNIFGQDFFTTENGVLEFNTTAEKISAIQKNIKAYEETKETALSSEIGLIYSFTEAYEELGSLEGEEALLLALEKQKAGNQDLQTWAATLDTEGLESGSIEQVLTFYKGIKTTAEQELFQSLLTDLDSFNFQEIFYGLGETGQLLEESPEIKEAFKSMYAEQFSGTYKRIAENLIDGLELDSLDEWLEKNEGKTEADYLQYLQQKVTLASKLQGKGSLAEIFAKGSIEELEAYNKFYEENQRLIEKSSGQKKKVALERAVAFETAFANFIDGGSVFGINMGDLDEAQQTALWELLKAEDVGTYDWKYRLEKFATETGQTLNNIDNLIYENINTRIERIFDSADETIKELENFTKKQEDGFELQDARAFASKIGKRMDEVFELKDGKLIISDYGKYITEYYDASIKEVEDLNSDYLAVLENFAQKDHHAKIRKATWRKVKEDYSEALTNIEGVSEHVQDLLVAITLTGNKELEDQVVAWVAENQYATEEDINNMLEELYAAGAITKQQLDSARETSTSNTAFNDFIKETENSFKDLSISYQDFKENFQLLAPDKAIPQTADAWADWFNNSLGFIDFRTGLITDFDAAKAFAKGLGDEDATKWMTDLIEAQIGSSFDKLRMGETLYTDVDKTSAKEALQTLGIKSQELIGDLLEDNIIDAEESLFILEQNFDSTKDNNLIDTAARIGADFSEIIENMVSLPGQIVASLAQYGIEGAALTPEMRDIINESRKATFDSMTGLMKGTGTWEEATRLQMMVGPGKKLQFRETSEGIQLMNESLGALLVTLQEDNSPLYAETYAEITKNIQDYYPELKDVFDIQKKIVKLGEAETDEKREQLRLLQAAANYASNTAGSKGFDFMSNSLAGNAENYLTYIENIGNAQNILKEFSSSGKIGAGDFMRMMQFAEDNGQKLPMSWQEIYAAVQTADSEGNIGVDVLNELFGDQGALAGIVDLMKNGDTYFRGKQYDIQADRSNTATYLEGGRDAIAENWEDITTGKAPLTVRIDGQTATEENAEVIAQKWAALTDFEKDEILNTGVWEISTDTTPIIQEAADSLGIIEKYVAQIAEREDVQEAVKNIQDKEAQMNADYSAVEAAQAALDEANEGLRRAEELNSAGLITDASKKVSEAQTALAAAEEAYATSSAGFATAKAEFDRLINETVVPEIAIDSEGLRANVARAFTRPFAVKLLASYIPLPGKWTGNVNGIALAEGTISKLTQGASLANKTLVGELGPELAVYNGQYHMLGQNGAEFVNLPSNAIVFNHKQTEGIVNGQMGIRGTALADGTIGPALSGGYTNLHELWELLINEGISTSASYNAWDSILGTGKGGTKKIERTDVDEGEEWYNYLRRIEKLEQEINQLEAERENIADGSAYLRNLRETQTIYQEQLIIQQQLLEYQKAQLELEQKQIKEKWGNGLKFTDEGLLEYIVGNEANGGKGIFELQQLMSEASGNQQLALIKELFPDYNPIDKDTGKALQGADLVAKFQEEFFGDIEHYNDLYDSVAETTTGLEDFKKAIKDVEDEIRDNRIEVEEKIYDLVVEGWEKSIEKMQDELDLLSEANERYINGLSESLQKEKDLYAKDQAVADREAMQRRLSLLRRSGGSASEIADLEKQLNDTLKDEYFQHQQETIDKISEASETQIEMLEQQIRIQEEQLAFSQEHGLIWDDVSQILAGSTSEILEFIQGNDPTFIEKSATEIGKQLEEWSKKVGMFTEERQREVYGKEEGANAALDASKLKGDYASQSDSTKELLQGHYKDAYIKARMEGKSEEEAIAAGYQAVEKQLKKEEENNDTGGKVSDEQKKGGTRWKFTYDGKERVGWRTKEAAIAEINKLDAAEQQKVLSNTALLGASDEKYNTTIQDVIKKRKAAMASLTSYMMSYSHGGIVDYTGLAMVHGSKSRPESFLNAEQTAQITEALRSNGKNSVLSDVRQAVTEIAAAAKALVMNETNNSSSINVAPGAVVVKVEKLNDKYDIDSVADDIMNKMVSIASKATSRGVNRR